MILDGLRYKALIGIELKILAPAFDKKAMTATYAGQTVKADALLSDFAAAAYGQTVTWQSSNPSIVSIDPNGKKAVIKALATGSSEITASVNGHSYKVTVTVP